MKKYAFYVVLVMSAIMYSAYAQKSTPCIPYESEQNFSLKENQQWEDLGGGVQRVILAHNTQMMMVKLKFDKDAVGKPHTHYHTQMTYVVSGKFSFTIDGEEKIVTAGDAMYMKPNVLHGCVCLEPSVIIDVFSPMRETFIKCEKP